jgi:hypothetical protein
MSNKDIRKQEELREAFRCIVSLAHAKHEDNKMSCACYRIKPFNRDWDPATVHEVSQAVKGYLQSWVIPALEEHLGLSEAMMVEIMERQHDERNAAIAKATSNPS